MDTHEVLLVEIFETGVRRFLCPRCGFHFIQYKKRRPFQNLASSRVILQNGDTTVTHAWDDSPDLDVTDMTRGIPHDVPFCPTPDKPIAKVKENLDQLGQVDDPDQLLNPWKDL